MPWLWNSNIAKVLMIGLGGASVQRSYARHYPDVSVETAELDPMVRNLARQYFHLKETGRQVVHIEDGRMFLRRAKATYDVMESPRDSIYPLA
jgi:spermidine synthase